MDAHTRSVGAGRLPRIVFEANRLHAIFTGERLRRAVDPELVSAGSRLGVLCSQFVLARQVAIVADDIDTMRSVLGIASATDGWR